MIELIIGIFTFIFLVTLLLFLQELTKGNYNFYFIKQTVSIASVSIILAITITKMLYLLGKGSLYVLQSLI